MSSIFDHRWQQLFSMEPEAFDTPVVSEVIERATSWELPDEYACVLRVFNKKTGKVKEKAYKTVRNAQKALDKLTDDYLEVTLYDQDDIRTSYKQTES